MLGTPGIAQDMAHYLKKEEDARTIADASMYARSWSSSGVAAMGLSRLTDT